MIPEPMINNILKIAKMIHEDYNRNRLKECPDKSLEYPNWEDLPPDLKYSNIRQAQKIPEKLALIDCYIGEGSDVITSFTEEEVEIMSIKEHDLWVEERESNGWVYAPVKNVDRKESPYIAPWEQIPDSIKEYDRESTRNIINLVNLIGLNVCRNPKKDEIIPEFKFYKGVDAPLIISVSGHIDICPEDIESAKESFEKLIRMLNEKYPNTKIIVMTALAEGSDRIIAKKAIELGLNIAPVFPFSKDIYENTFKGIGYDDVVQSVEDFHFILSNELTYTPCVLIKKKVNEVLGFRALAAYLVSNSHIIVSLWNGVRSQYRGGTYDVIRMAFEDVDSNLIKYTSPRVSLSDSVENTDTHYLNSLNDALIAWIGVNRLSDGVETDIPLTSCMMDEKGLPDLCFITDCAIGQKGNLKTVFTREKLNCERRIQITDKRVAKIVYDIPSGYDQAFVKLDEMNSDIHEINISDSPHEVDFKPLEYSMPSGKKINLLFEMTERLEIIDKLSMLYRKRSGTSVNRITLLTCAYSVFFSLLILFSGSAFFSIAYSLIYVIATIFIFFHRSTEEHDKFVSYHSIAENLKVEYYWSIVGLCDTSYDNITNYVSGGQTWMRTVMKSYSSYFINDYASCFNIGLTERVAYVKESWVKKQVDYTRRMLISDSRKLKNYDRYSRIISSMIIVISAIVTVVVVLMLEGFNEIILTYHDYINSFESPVTVFILLKIMMIVLVNVSSYIVMKKNQLDYNEESDVGPIRMVLNRSMVKMEEMQNTSESAMIRRNLDIIHELGLFAIGNNNNWVRDSVKKDYAEGDLVDELSDKVKDLEFD
ncbi:MAG: hypothetical protein IJ469_02235 [Candidatus Methanomethylophilaceae archaeon]|nr:hypothetical protein [Candidatus Methanomethylophilaceae archaeon]